MLGEFVGFFASLGHIADAGHCERLACHALGSVIGLGRKTVTGILCAIGQQHQDWTVHYRLYSKKLIDIERGFGKILNDIVALLPAHEPIIAAMDDTLLRKRGKKIPGVGYLRDPLGPPFQTNLVRAQRLVQVSISLSKEDEGVSRMIPVLIRDAPPVKKPSKKASDEEWKEYRAQKKKCNLSAYGLQCLKDVRTNLDEDGQQARTLWASVDGSHTNRTVLRNVPERTAVVGRIRKDASLFYLPEEGAARNRIYGQQAPTPEQLRKDDMVLWQGVTLRCNGRTHKLRIKDINHLRWQASGQQLLHLVVIAPFGYRLKKKHKISYREPVYLICTDVTMSISDIVKTFLHRWDIEVNFRDEKTLIGTGQAQVRNPQSVKALPQMSVLSYATLLLSAAKVFGVDGVPSSIEPPKWYAKKHNEKQRPSTNDLIAQLRHELWSHTITENLPGFSESKYNESKPVIISPPLNSAVFSATG